MCQDSLGVGCLQLSQLYPPDCLELFPEKQYLFFAHHRTTHRDFSLSLQTFLKISLLSGKQHIRICPADGPASTPSVSPKACRPSSADTSPARLSKRKTSSPTLLPLNPLITAKGPNHAHTSKISATPGIPQNYGPKSRPPQNQGILKEIHNNHLWEDSNKRTPPWGPNLRP